MRIEGGGSGIDPNEEQVAPGSETQSAEEPTKTSLRERLKGGIDNFKEKLKERRENNEIKRNNEEAQERRLNQLTEVLKQARTPEEIQNAMLDVSFKDFRDAELRGKYGKSALGKLKALMSGEYDLKYDNDQNVIEINPNFGDLNVATEAGRRLVSTVFNKRTAISAVMLAGLGLLTGGVGWAAGGVVLGGVGGRGMAEMYELFTGTTREARSNVLYAELARYNQLREIAKDANTDSDPVSKNKKLVELVDIFYKQGEDAVVNELKEANQQLEVRQARFEKNRNRLHTVGEVVGGIAGLTSVLNGGVEHLDFDFFNKENGQSIFHGVQQYGDSYSFLYSSGQEAGLANQLGATIQGIGQYGGHALEGVTTAKVVAYTVAERILPVLVASSIAGGSLGRFAERFGGDKFNPDNYITKKQIDGSYHIFSKEEDGSILRWTEKVTEEESEVDGKKIKAKKKEWIKESVDLNDLPPGAIDKFKLRSEQSAENNSERLKDKIETPNEYIRRIADENQNAVPVDNWNWNNLDPEENLAELKQSDINKLEKWYYVESATKQPDGRIIKSPKLSSDGKIIDVAVLGVDINNNRIAYLEGATTDGGVFHRKLTVTRLDDFLKHFALHQRAGATDNNDQREETNDNTERDTNTSLKDKLDKINNDLEELASAHERGERIQPLSNKERSLVKNYLLFRDILNKQHVPKGVKNTIRNDIARVGNLDLENDKLLIRHSKLLRIFIDENGAEEFSNYIRSAVHSVKNKLNELGVDYLDWTDSPSWVAKELLGYLDNHSESDINSTREILSDDRLKKEIINRRIGLEFYNSRGHKSDELNRAIDESADKDSIREILNKNNPEYDDLVTLGALVSTLRMGEAGDDIAPPIDKIRAINDRLQELGVNNLNDLIGERVILLNPEQLAGSAHTRFSPGFIPELLSRNNFKVIAANEGEITFDTERDGTFNVDTLNALRIIDYIDVDIDAHAPRPSIRPIPEPKLKAGDFPAVEANPEVGGLEAELRRLNVDTIEGLEGSELKLINKDFVHVANIFLGPDTLEENDIGSGKNMKVRVRGAGGNELFIEARSNKGALVNAQKFLPFVEIKLN